MKAREEVEATKGIMFERLEYTPEDGKVWWKLHPRGPSYSGKEAGNLMHDGYRKLTFGGKQYMVHRVAWLLHDGDWPIGEIDHIDGCRSNNKLTNLRDVSHSVNMQNRKSCQSNNKTGFLGVVKSGNKYAANIYRNGKQNCLGSFETAELAHQSYKEACR
jgi:hypothetical protein